jgi:hypothetical protein
MVALIVLFLHAMSAKMNDVVPDRLIPYDGLSQFGPVYSHSITDDIVYCRQDEFSFGGKAEMSVKHHDSTSLALLL